MARLPAAPGAYGQPPEAADATRRSRGCPSRGRRGRWRAPCRACRACASRSASARDLARASARGCAAVCRGVPDADRVAERDLVAAHRERALRRSRAPASDRRRPRRGSPTPSRRSRGRASRASRAGPMVVLEGGERLGDRLVHVLPVVGLARAERRRRSPAFPPRCARSRPLAFGQSALKRHPARRRFACVARRSSASASCGIHFGRDEARDLDALEPGSDERVDEAELAAERHRRPLVLQAVARRDLVDGDAVGQALET